MQGCGKYPNCIYRLLEEIAKSEFSTVQRVFESNQILGSIDIRLLKQQNV